VCALISIGLPHATWHHIIAFLKLQTWAIIEIIISKVDESFLATFRNKRFDLVNLKTLVFGGLPLILGYHHILILTIDFM
jgi:hypothetical protein